MKNLPSLIASGGLAAAGCLSARAGPLPEARTQIVRYIASASEGDAAVASLYRQIDAAAQRVCGERLVPGSLAVSKAWRQCVRLSLRAALAQIRTPAMAAYAASQGGHALRCGHGKSRLKDLPSRPAARNGQGRASPNPSKSLMRRQFGGAW